MGGEERRDHEDGVLDDLFDGAEVVAGEAAEGPSSDQHTAAAPTAAVAASGATHQPVATATTAAATRAPTVARAGPTERA